MLADLPDTHDLSHLHTALKYCERFGVALDCGAHRGIWTRLLCDRFEHVFAIEPTARVYQVDERAHVVNAAVGAEEGFCGLADGLENTGQTHCVDGDTVEVITIDSMDLSGLDFLKLDVEGWELFALQGGRETIQRFKPVVILEENGLCQRYGIQPGSAGKLLELWGYTLREVCNKDFIYTC